MRRLAFLLVGLLAVTAQAQDFPTRPIRMIVPYAPGGLPDTMTRIIGPKMSEALGQQIVVENRPGAGGISGTEVVARSTADGYTLLIADVGQLAINPHLFKALPYDPLKDLAPVSLIGSTALFLVLQASIPANDFRELVALAKAKPGSMNYGSSGLGSIHHLTTEAMKAAFGLDIVHVPFKGMGQAVPALLGGQVSMLFSALPAIEAHVKAGKVKLLASHPVGIVISDQNMPGLTGVEFLRQVRKLYPDVIRIVFTSSQDPKVFADAVNEAGIHKFIMKDWDKERLRTEVRDVSRRYRPKNGMLPTPTK